MVVVVCRHYSGEVCLAISVAAAVAGDRVAAGVEEDSAAVAVLEEVSAAVVISAEVVLVEVGKKLVIDHLTFIICHLGNHGSK